MRKPQVHSGFPATRLFKHGTRTALLLMLVALVVGCAAPQTPATPTKAAAPGATAAPTKAAPVATKPADKPAAQQEPLKVGFPMAFTGPRAQTFEGIAKGARLATEMVNSAGGISGRQVQLIELDTQEDPDKSITAYKRLIDQEKVVAILGPSINASVKATRPLIANGPIATYPTSSAKPEPDSYGFQVMMGTTTIQKALMQYLKKNNMTKIALMATTDATGEDAVRDVSAAAKEAGGIEVVSERYNANDVDVIPQMTKIRSDKSIKVIVIWSTGQQAAIPIKNAVQLGIDLPIYISPGNFSNNFLKLIVGSEPSKLWVGGPKGVAWYDLPDNDETKPLAKAFAERYQAKYNEPADLIAFAGYDPAKLIFDALKAVGPDSKKMKEWIESQKTWPGAAATHTFTKQDHEGDILETVAINQLTSGRWRILK